MKRSQLRGWTLFWNLFIGLGAFAGGWGMLSDVTGKALGLDGVLSCLSVLPFNESLFSDFMVPAIALIIVVGATNMIALLLLFVNRDWGITWSVICGIILMLWTTLQFIIFPINLLTSLYFVFGFIQCINAVYYRRADISEGRRNTRHTIM